MPQKPIFLVIASLLVAINFTPAHSADLMAQCEKLKRQADRDKCITEVVKAFATTAPAQPAPQPVLVAPPQATEKESRLARSAAVLRAGADLKSVVESGVSLHAYRPYVLNYAIELGRYKTLATAEESAAIKSLDAAQRAFEDAAEYWQKDINFYAREANRISYAGGLPTNLGGTATIVARYHIPTRNSDFWGFEQGADRGSALSTIWRFANTRLKEARLILEDPSYQPAEEETSPTISEWEINVADQGLRRNGCSPTGALRVIRRDDGKDTYYSRCDDGAVKAVICNAVKCSATSLPAEAEK